jgi:hypothetical protein
MSVDTFYLTRGRFVRKAMMDMKKAKMYTKQKYSLVLIVDYFKLPEINEDIMHVASLI